MRAPRSRNGAASANQSRRSCAGRECRISAWRCDRCPCRRRSPEGLVIDRTTHMGHLKGCLVDFCRAFFEVDDLPLRFCPSYFPFTEPSAAVDIGCSWKDGELRIGAGDSWLEILGSGMVHPNVIANCGLDPAIYQGFAFGMGIDRIGMLKYGIPDLRSFF